MLHVWTSPIVPALILAGMAILLAAAVHDIVARTVPNWLSLLLALLGLCARVADGNVIAGVLAAFTVFAIATFCWHRGWLGGGDVKLLGAAALVVPPLAVIPFVVAMSISGSVLALVYLAARRVVRPVRSGRPAGLLARALRVERWRIHRGGPLPYACAITAGFLFIMI